MTVVRGLSSWTIWFAGGLSPNIKWELWKSQPKIESPKFELDHSSDPTVSLRRPRKAEGLAQQDSGKDATKTIACMTSYSPQTNPSCAQGRKWFEFSNTCQACLELTGYYQSTWLLWEEKQDSDKFRGRICVCSPSYPSRGCGITSFTTKLTATEAECLHWEPCEVFNP